MKKNNIKDDTKPMSLLSLILSFMALFVISGLLFFPLRPETRQVLIGLDFIICSIFILQLGIDLIRATDRVQFMKRHWIDFLASLPMIEPLRYARLFSILRVILVIRSSRSVIRQLLKNKHETTLASILLLMVILLTAGSSIMLFLEGQSPNANIQDGGDAMWWALVTISTVGYGDHYPVTDAGRILAAGLIICGVGLFGMISGLVTSMITSPSKIQTTRSENKERLLLELVEKQDEIIKRLDRLERQKETNTKREP
ncbi:cAMP-dependent Kef-type K+ transporter [Vibrio orientalis CIP 102891 = ATCC 33934]|uniref:cAMP-dependent Kef-type K+ transport system n=1 Tax=Vibrio orientalis CIP 102891 = ATCC 33934 TaxID=675816 RepID=C9QN08_VIBOR|nr:potassium channel family protein [Vibrio orientalis]EEX93258.1 cAMP-dependent Kef-type K+ transport system [Vibrio orientalis CIP 102891 = ATCC 33934]EGU50074.1 cAMP-dependent Kef-type K+ transporter [Vibrio orientalis CIP 102891 = ATCC 33934]